jgi:hypothetical protein
LVENVIEGALVAFILVPLLLLLLTLLLAIPASLLAVALVLYLPGRFVLEPAARVGNVEWIDV